MRLALKTIPTRTRPSSDGRRLMYNSQGRGKPSISKLCIDGKHGACNKANCLCKEAGCRCRFNPPL